MSITKTELMKLQNGSDVRGIACEGIEGEHVTLTSEAAYLIGRAFAIWLLKKKNIAPEECIVGVGTDSRITGPEIKKQTIRGMLDEASTYPTVVWLPHRQCLCPLFIRRQDMTAHA